jgi:hypothetical protein
MEEPMAFKFKLELQDGTPADPPTLTAAVPDWKPQPAPRQTF